MRWRSGQMPSDSVYPRCPDSAARAASIAVSALAACERPQIAKIAAGQCGCGNADTDTVDHPRERAECVEHDVVHAIRERRVAAAPARRPARTEEHRARLGNLDDRYELAERAHDLVVPGAGGEVGGDRVKPLFEHLGGKHTYEAIRIARLLIRLE